jgi:sugar phosphate isomerase/epimerase
MNGHEPNNLSRLCIHTITTRSWSLEEAVKNYSAAGVRGITIWRDAIEGRNLSESRKLVQDSGLEIVSLCRGGFFAWKDEAKRKESIEDNKKVIEQAHELNAPLLVLVCGADPAQSLEESRIQIAEGIGTILPFAAQANVKLGIEPLHPMYADTRSAINSLSQANDLAEELNSPWVGVTIDVYHLWWDPKLEEEIKRCGRNGHIFSFHVCDWKVPTTDLLFDRGIMGEGCIPVKKIRTWVEESGFNGFVEVEIFSSKYWQEDQQVFLDKIIKAYKENA